MAKQKKQRSYTKSHCVGSIFAILVEESSKGLPGIGFKLGEEQVLIAPWLLVSNEQRQRSNQELEVTNKTAEEKHQTLK